MKQEYLNKAVFGEISLVPAVDRWAVIVSGSLQIEVELMALQMGTSA